MFTIERVFRVVVFLGVVGLLLTGTGQAANAQKAPKDYSRLVFDASKRKKTKSQITDFLSYSAYANLRYQGERNIRLDDGRSDYSDEIAGYLGLAMKADLSSRIMAFGHVELDIRQKTTHSKSYPTKSKLKVKEALLSVRLTDNQTISAGRLRFADTNKSMADASVDGVHYAFKTPDSALELALFRDVFKDRGTYAMLHATRFSKTQSTGFYVLAEENGQDQRLHLAAYLNRKPTSDLSYTLNGAAVFGDAANGETAGFAVDFRAMKSFSDQPGKPQITFGFAAGTKGYRPSGLQSNKTYDGGQTQFHRFGYVFQPELTNMAIATIGLGLRPSRKFSLDLYGHAYSQLSRSTQSPDARVSGAVTGRSTYLGSEVSLVGAWRPNKKSKVEFGVGVFKPGKAFTNREPAKRFYARFTTYF